MFEKYSESTTEILLDAYGHSRQFKSEEISSAHILLSLTLCHDNPAAVALANMNITTEKMQEELERLLLIGSKKNFAPGAFESCSFCLEDLKFTDGAKEILKRASQLRIFFGHKLVEPEHLLLAVIDVADEASVKVLEELGANCVHMRWLTVKLIAEADSLDSTSPSLRPSVVEGISEIMSGYTSIFDQLEQLSVTASVRVTLPQKAEIARLLFITYMPDFLSVQIAYQRYLLDMTLRLLQKRAGGLDPEFAASTVSSCAQNLRQEVRTIIEYLLSNEFRLSDKFPDEADYDLIGSVIEDLWWTHSEEIALNEVFDEAVDDHRRKQMLNLQKRRLEISERFKKLEKRLRETFKQCFLKESYSSK